MIIHEIKNRPTLVCLIVLLWLSLPVCAQEVQPAPTFNLLSYGYGAKALGLGGAFVAVADDLTAIYWNPAGLGQLEGIQFHGDYRFQGDSDEDFAAEVQPNVFESPQSYSVTGNQLQSLSASYAILQKSFTIVPAFAWQRLSNGGPKRELKQTAGLVSFIDPQHLVFIQSEGDFKQQFNGGEDEFAFAAAVRFKKNVMVGATWSFLRSGIDDRLNGTFHDNFIPGVNQPNVRQDISLDRSREDSLSGNYLRLGMLYVAQRWSAGGYIRLPYTRKSTISLHQKGSVSVNGDVPTPFDQTATAESQVDIPSEYGGALSIRSSQRNMITGSISYANWADAVLATSNSSNVLLIPETTLPYPTLRANAGLQYSLLQLRLGTEYIIAGNSQAGIAFRAGYFWDGQPYANEKGEREKFKGTSFGFGYMANTFHINIAWVNEKGDITFTPFSRDESHLRNRRWVVSVDLIGR
jgi:hypothetical protein